ncbi:hypothetical protein H310_04618 [Aphanomyces invadans]|uniref:Uncharacterized protein n=1 Tax=Aphanomyces invadans TaxID=157072 RepID=A0A024UDM0_9STRA|nr:hypothetical protein H310_04618 [Aphanomyces invadans]ETW04310.1 hypothetical protein H310_04618 [Aphanomyces invadans]|eukprot:XP_008867266.1 hypothetical protein H310_04618 [Aphanomyces invadans]
MGSRWAGSSVGRQSSLHEEQRRRHHWTCDAETSSPRSIGGCSVLPSSAGTTKGGCQMIPSWAERTKTLCQSDQCRWGDGFHCRRRRRHRRGRLRTALGWSHANRPSFAACESTFVHASASGVLCASRLPWRFCAIDSKRREGTDAALPQIDCALRLTTVPSETERRTECFLSEAASVYRYCRSLGTTWRS